MALLGSILKTAVDIRGKMPKRGNFYAQQKKTLKKLLKKAEHTAFGEHYHFSKLLNEKDPVAAFQSTVKTHDYSSMYKEWWFRSLKGEPFVCWPNHTKYFALSSGTSESSSKYIPVTKDMLRAFKKGSVRQMLAMAHYDLPNEHFQKSMLAIGGSTMLDFNGTYFQGDLSGITAANIPLWFQHYYKPGKTISRYKDWDTKLHEIVKNAKDWDIGIIVGVPAWVQILMERVIEHYQVKTIHDIWPNLRIYVHAGVAIGPYINSINKLTSFPLIFSDTYLASEGLIAYQERPNAEQGMRLLLDNGIFFEFVPFNEENFDSDGAMREKVNALSIRDVELGKEYALLLSTCAGAWRYLIGDVVRFTDLDHAEIVITGRTKHFLSLCGEHLSVDNMSRAISLTADELNIEINEFCVAGIPHGTLFAHHWFVGSNVPVDETALRNKIDNHLKEINDDYRVERISALKDVFVTVLPDSAFIDFMASKGKLGGAFKFPRVVKGKQLEEWEEFIKQYKK
ncbi:MAG: GH3 auxin-responsive promoter family protein [Bacteroidetes bacterium]|nr:GH3 auxin-responsive promoter family protein [Bacteroidota bacterium]